MKKILTLCSEGNDFFAEDLERFKNEASKLMGLSPFYLLSGRAGTWQGHKDYQPEKLTDLDEFFDKVTGDELEMTLYSNGVVDIAITHHDGRNSYTLTPIFISTKKEILEALRYYQDDADTVYHLQNFWETDYLYRATKEALVDALYNA